MGTKRIGASAKQAAQKVQKAAPKALGGTKRVSAPIKPKAPTAGGTGLFGIQRPSTGEYTTGLPSVLLQIKMVLDESESPTRASCSMI